MSKTANGECEPWVVASRLRDHLLLPRERKDPFLWKKVLGVILEWAAIDCPVYHFKFLSEKCSNLTCTYIACQFAVL